MSDKPLVLSVDDDELMQDLMHDALHDHYRLVFASQGAEALAALDQELPELVILDVDMPVMDGFAACREIKVRDGCADLPVMFLAGSDSIDDRLAALDAGADDYLLKPLHRDFLLAKTRALLANAAQRKALHDSLCFATSTTMTVMSNMSELGLLLEAMKLFNTQESFPALAEAIARALSMFELEGIVQVRWGSGLVSYTTHGPASPLDVSVLGSVSGMERIVHFKSRMAINYPQVTVLATNVSSEPDRAGRLRDHLAMLAEAAAVRVDSIAKALESSRRGNTIMTLIERLSQTLTDIDQLQRASRAEVTMSISMATEATENAMLSVALTESQEAYLASTIRAGFDKIVAIQDGGVDIQNRLSRIIDDLRAAV